MSGGFKKFSLYVHNKLGLYLGIFLVIQGLTGSLLIFSLEIDSFFNAKYFNSPPRDPARIPYQQYVRQIEKREAPAKVVFIEMQSEAGGALKFVLESFSGKRLYLDPSDGKAIGERAPVEIFRWPLYYIHTGMFAGAGEHLVVGTLGGLLLLLSLSGLYAWWPAPGGFKKALRITWNKGAIRFNRELHNLSGVVVFSFYIFLSLSGLGLVFYDETRAFLNFVSGHRPKTNMETKLNQSPGPKPSLDNILEKARIILPEARVSFISISTQKDIYEIRMRYPGEDNPAGRNILRFNVSSGRLLSVRDTRELPWNEKFMDALYPLHIGRAGGILTRVLFFIIGLTPGLLFCTGLILWHKKKKAKRRVLSSLNSINSLE